MQNFNINQHIIIYPNEKGWVKLYELYRKSYPANVSNKWVSDNIELHKTKDGGFEEQLWSLIEYAGEMFHEHSNYLESTNIKLDTGVTELIESKIITDETEAAYTERFKTGWNMALRTTSSDIIKIR